MTRPTDYTIDVSDIQQIPIITDLLNVICHTTGMGFSAIARVTEDRWITCSSHDDLALGLQPGDELPISTTFCDRVRRNNTAVIFDHASENPEFCDDPIVKLYNIESYISVPITRQDGTFFGTLCALDPKPNKIRTSHVIGMFKLFSELISFHLHAIEELRIKTSKLEEVELLIQDRTLELVENNQKLEKQNAELQSFAYLTSHDLQEPLRKIQTFISLINVKERVNLPENVRVYLTKIQNATVRMRALISDLFSYTHTDSSERRFEMSNLVQLTSDVKLELADDLHEKSMNLEITGNASGEVVRFQFKQMLYNLIGNSIKYKDPDKPNALVTVNFAVITDNVVKDPNLEEGKQYCHITISDNGIGFPQIYADRIFELFQRLHTGTEFEGTGIGLAIVKKIVDNHHGLITASSVLTKGTSFNIYLPTKQD